MSDFQSTEEWVHLCARTGVSPELTSDTESVESGEREVFYFYETFILYALWCIPWYHGSEQIKVAKPVANFCVRTNATAQCSRGESTITKRNASEPRR